MVCGVTADIFNICVNFFVEKTNIPAQNGSINQKLLEIFVFHIILHVIYMENLGK